MDDMYRNRKVVLVGGPPATGKSASLWQLIEKYGDSVAYINTDGKVSGLPFDRNKIKLFITPKDSIEINPGVRSIEEREDIDWIVIDTLSFWFDQLEKQHVIFSEDSRGNWGKIYQAEIASLLHFANNVSKKNWIFLTHTATDEEVTNFVRQTKATVKGAIGKKGLESWFDVVIYTWTYERDDDENPIGYGFQVKKTGDTIGFSVRSPMGMFPKPFLKSNNILKVFEYIDKYNEGDVEVSMLDPDE
jgi:hypothetical protein